MMNGTVITGSFAICVGISHGEQNAIANTAINIIEYSDAVTDELFLFTAILVATLYVAYATYLFLSMPAQPVA